MGVGFFGGWVVGLTDVTDTLGTHSYLYVRVPLLRGAVISWVGGLGFYEGRNGFRLLTTGPTLGGSYAWLERAEAD